MNRNFYCLVFLSIALFIGCQQTTKTIDYSSTDSLITNYQRDSIRQDVETKIATTMAFDTAGLSTAPIKILTAKPHQDEYSNYKGIYLSWKNISNKTISAIKFRWYGINAFGESADMGSFQAGIGGGFTDEPLEAGKTTSGKWSITSRDLKQIVIAYPTEVVFFDGTKWKLDL